MSYLALAKKVEARLKREGDGRAKPNIEIEEVAPRAWVVEDVWEGETLYAHKICSEPLQDHLWLILDRRFIPTDGLAIYYPEEFAELKTKTLETLKEIHKVKLKFPGCRVIQEGSDA